MSVTAQALITRSFKALQAISSLDGTLTPGEANDGLDVYNSMLDSWSNETLLCIANKEQSVPLTPGNQMYTIGAGGVVNAVRPLSVRTGYGAARVLDANNISYDVEVVEQEVWNQIGNLAVTGQIPTTMFYDPQYPLGIINVFPVPLLNYTLIFDARLQLNRFASLNDTLSLPPGYELLIVVGGAVYISNLLGIPIPPVAPGAKSLIEQYNEARSVVKRTNSKPIVAQLDSSVVSRSNSTYNIYRDSPGSR